MKHMTKKRLEENMHPGLQVFELLYLSAGAYLVATYFARA